MVSPQVIYALCLNLTRLFQGLCQHSEHLEKKGRMEALHELESRVQ
jgi:hypothetical protein